MGLPPFAVDVCVEGFPTTASLLCRYCMWEVGGRERERIERMREGGGREEESERGKESGIKGRNLEEKR